jgi:malonyl CoA-acyl carrier protein transacylase
MHVDPGVMAAVDVPPDLLKKMIRGRDDVHIGNINSPNQIVLSGNTEAVKDLCKRLKEMGYRATLLRVSMAFHSPIMKVIHDELEAYIASIPFHSPQIPVVSNTTMAPYPSDPDEIRRILMAHLESTVHWMNNVQTLWKDYGVRLFVEVGPGETLSNLITDTLPESACVQTCLPSAEGLTYKTALAQLFVQGHLKVEKEPRFFPLSALRKTPESHRIDPAPALRASELGPAGSNPAGSNPVERIIQREIIRFVIETFGRVLKPNILEAIRQELDPTFQEGDLSSVIKSMLAGFEPPEAQKQVSRGKPASPPLDSTPAILGQAPHLPSVAPESQDLTERLIRIIMDATGFTRDEIQPDMDLRRDLSIRSSRLPIIMDAAERQFGITIELEDFIGVRTVKDIAQRVSKVIARPGGTGLQSATKAVDPDPVQDEILKPSKDEARLKRLVFNHAALELAASIPMELSPGESVLLLSPDRDDGIAGRARDILRLDYGVDTFPMLFMQGNLGFGEEGQDIRTDEGASRALDRIAGLSPLAGMVITLCQGGSGRLKSMADVSLLLMRLFLLLKAFLQSPAKKFVVLIHSREDTETLDRLVAEGMLGLFLSAAQEYPSVQFRTLEIQRDTDLRVALRGALDRGCTLVEIIHRDGRVLTSEGHLAPSVFGDSASLALGPGDVVVMSGGATGISAHLARCLVPFAPRLVFLGRTPLDPGIHPAKPHPEHSSSEGFTFEHRASEIARTLGDLRSSGIEATYHTCDVTAPEAVRAIMGEVASRYGKIDGIIHGAGVLRDGPLSQMTPDDFSMVTDVKFLGAWNLFSAAEGAGLRFFVGLSSAAAIQGNPGQANYAAGNRMMSALLRTLRRKKGAIRFKALMLPPVEGAGMAEDPEVRELMKRKGVAYIHVNELAGLFCRELFVAPAEDDWVMFMRRLPSLRTAVLNDTTRPSLRGELDGGTVSLSPEDFPMIEKISCLDIRREELEAFRSFSLEKDLWIGDHRPFKFVKHPLVSAAMVLETFMEAARILYPHLQVRGVRQVRLMDMIQCPPGVPRPSRISCRRVGNGLREILCEVSLETQEISPSGSLTDRFTPHCKGRVILDGGGGYLGEGLPDFPVRLDELRKRPMNHKKMLKWYKDHSGLEGRYRVMEFLEGAGPGVVRGRTTYRETSDFANLRNARYQYSPYLFEALLQLVGFYIAATDPSERRSMIPMEIKEMRFFRKCRAGERITLEGRMRAQDDEGVAWDARGIDDQGRTIMQIHGIRMHWVSD